MKIKKILLLINCLIWLALLPKAQTIVLNIDTACKPSISFNNVPVPNNGHIDLPILAPDLLQFYYKGIQADNLVTITILSLNTEATQMPKRIKPSVFGGDNNPIAAKTLLKSSTGSLQVNYMEPFRIIMGCTSNPNSFITCDFFPLNTAAIPQPGTANTQSQGVAPVTVNTSGKTEAVYQPGSAVYDALKLADRDNLTPNEMKRIIQFYWPNDTLDNVNEVMDSIKNNPYLKMANITALKGDKFADAQAGGLSLSSLSLSSIGGLDVTTIVDGLAKFLVKRTKEELSTAFFEKFKEELDKYPDLKTLFPKTVNLLGSIGTEVYNYEKYIQNLREAFKDDIENLYQTLPGIIDNHPAFFARHHTLAACLRSGCYIVGALQQKVHPGDMLANYPLDYLDTESPNFKGAIQTLQLLSASMRDTTGTDNSYWVNIKYLRQLVNSKNAFLIYLGLVYQMAKTSYDNVPFDNTSLVGVLKNVAPRIAQVNDIYNAYKVYILGFAEKTDALNSMIASYTKPTSDSMAIELFKKYFDASQDLLEYASQVGQLPLANRIKFLDRLPEILQPYFTITNLTTDLIVDVNRKNYSSAINNAILIYDFVRNKPAQHDLAAARTANANTGNGATSNATAGNTSTPVASAALTANPPSLTTALSDADTATNTLRNLAKYGAFMSTIATAKTSDEVAAAIEAFALPAGSARIKRQSNFNVALNAYVGPYFGGEYMTTLKKNATSFSAGLTAPVGIAISWGKMRSKEVRKSGKPVGYKSLSLFIPLIDIGTVAAFRFGDDSTSLNSTIQLKNIISPGLYLYYGLGKCPLSIGIGAQLGPQLRNISATDIKVDKKSYIRFGLTVAVDLPLLNFHTKND